MDDILRGVCIALWAPVTAVTFGAVWRSFTTRTYSNDGWQGLLFFLSFIIILFQIRGIIAKSDDSTRIALEVLIGCAGVYALRVVVMYGRGS